MTQGEACSVSATALNQFNEPLASQPAITWSASSGQISGTTFTPPTAYGTSLLIASSSGFKDTMFVINSRFMPLPDTGAIRSMLLLQSGSNPYLVPSGNLDDVQIPETTIRPKAGDSLSYSGYVCKWNRADDNEGRWLDDPRHDGFVGYGALYLYTTSPKRVWIYSRVDDFMKVFFDDVVVYKRTMWDTAAVEYRSASAVTLKKGLTRMLVKMIDGGNGNYFSIRLADTIGANIKGVGYLFSPDTGTPPATSLMGPDLKVGNALSGCRISVRIGRVILDNLPQQCGSVSIVSLGGASVMRGEVSSRGRAELTTGRCAAGMYLIQLNAKNGGVIAQFKRPVGIDR